MLNTFLFYVLIFAVVGVPFYFNYRVQNMAKDESSLQPINRLTAKLSAFVICALYFMSFLAFSIRNAAFSKVGFFACVFSFFLLYSFRSKVIHEIREIPADSKERFQRSARSLVAMLLLYGVYFATVQLLIPHTGTLPAIAVAIVFIVYATPVFIRVWMPTQKMHDSLIKEEILAVFRQAKNPIHEIYLLDTDRFKVHNALVCGPKYGFGPFRRCLFVTKNLFEALERDEIHAVICHEASHFKLHHILKRGLMGFVAVLLSIVAVVMPVGFLSILVRIPTSANFGLLIVSTLGCIFVQLAFLFRVIRKQEFEADLGALDLGASPASLISALEKITQKNGMPRTKEDGVSRFMFGHAHPSTEERVAAIIARGVPEDAKVLPPWKFTAVYGSIVLALGVFAVIEMESKVKSQPERTIATEKK